MKHSCVTNVPALFAEHRFQRCSRRQREQVSCTVNSMKRQPGNLSNLAQTKPFNASVLVGLSHVCALQVQVLMM